MKSMEDVIIRAFMPIQKTSDGGFVGILSDDSLDRDGEFMTKNLLHDWANDGRPLPMLANHENKMEKFIGGWKNKRLVSKGANNALVADPFFFSKDANPLAYQIKKQVEEALANGLEPGISIGAIAKETVEKEIDGQKRRGYNKAEIVEATVVPIQSNRNASFTMMAKKFDIESMTTKIKEESCSTTNENNGGTIMVEETSNPVTPAPSIQNEVTKGVEEVKNENIQSFTDLCVKVGELSTVVKNMESVLMQLQKSISVPLQSNDMPTFEKMPDMTQKEVELGDGPLTVEKMIELRYKR